MNFPYQGWMNFQRMVKWWPKGVHMMKLISQIFSKVNLEKNVLTILYKSEFGWSIFALKSRSPGLLNKGSTHIITISIIYDESIDLKKIFVFKS